MFKMKHSGIQKVLFCLLALVLITGCAGGFDKKRALSEPYSQLALNHLENNNNQAALVELKRAQKENPKDPEVYYFTTLAYIRLNKPQDALENIDKAIKYGNKLGLEHPGMKSEAYNLKGNILYSMGDNEKALKAYSKALGDDLFSTPEFTLHNMGNVYLSMKDIEKAKEYQKRALNKNPHYAPAWYALGTISISEGDYSAAVNELKHAVTEFPDYTNAHWELAQLYEKTGNITNAIKHLDAIISIEPQSPAGIMASRKRTVLLNRK